MPLVSYDRNGPIATVTIDDGKANVMSTAMLRAIDAALDRADQEDAALILRGRPGIFSAGFDLKIFASGEAEPIYDMLKAGAELALKLFRFPAPVVAIATGHAFPMGAFLLLGADFRIGVEGDFRIGLNEVTIGIPVPSFGLELARARLVPPYFQRTALTGEMFDPHTALAAGFLDQVVAPAALGAAQETAAQRLAAIDPLSHATTKSRVRGSAAAAIRAAIDAEITLSAYLDRARRFVLPASVGAH
jgi:enoyl-CoA hydratase